MTSPDARPKLWLHDRPRNRFIEAAPVDEEARRPPRAKIAPARIILGLLEASQGVLTRAACDAGAFGPDGKDIGFCLRENGIDVLLKIAPVGGREAAVSLSGPVHQAVASPFGGNVIQLLNASAESENAIAHSNRLAVLGTLTAGLAHEIRNALVSIKTFIDLIPERKDDEEFATEFLQITNEEVTRITDLLDDLLSFLRPTGHGAGPEDIHALLESTITLVKNEAAKKALTLTCIFAPGSPAAAVSPGQIKQVLLNLLLNAIESTPEQGKITVETSVERGGSEITIRVRDSGPGVPAEIRQHIFSPFYTTKSRGSGLGLAIANEIIEHHRGSITIENSPVGASFAIRLPLMPDEEGPSATRRPRHDASSPRPPEA